MEIREAMEKAAEAVETETTSTPIPEPGETTATEPVEVAAETPTETPAKTLARDEDGRFAKTEKAARKTAEAAPKGGVHGAASAAPPAVQGKADGAAPPPPVPSAAPASPAVKAPQSWSPQAREAFSKAPPEVQREVERREREITRALSETAEARKIHAQVQQAIGPLEGIARANGMDGMTLAGEGARAMATIYAGDPQVATQTILSAIQILDRRTGGKGLELLNAALAGQPQAPAAPQPVDVERLVEQKWQERERAAEQQANLHAVQEFRSSNPEFLPYVEQDMAALLRLDRAKGGNMTVQQAYDRACKMNDDVQSIVQQRKAAEAARTQQQATARTQAAASSVRSTPAAAPQRAAQPKSIREAMEMADAAQSGRV